LSLAGDGRNASSTTRQFLTLDTDAKIESGMSGSPIINETVLRLCDLDWDSGVGSNKNPSLTMPAAVAVPSWMSSSWSLSERMSLWSTKRIQGGHRAMSEKCHVWTVRVSKSFFSRFAEWSVQHVVAFRLIVRYSIRPV